MLLPGTLVNARYRIVQAAGQGGMGAVYEAVDLRLHSTVALKQMIIAASGGQAFEQEARILAALRHPLLPVVSDYFSENDTQFLVMQFIRGQDLATLLAQRGSPFPANDVFRWAGDLLDTLIYLHNQAPPVIHRDIKPHNLKLTEDGRIVLLDFGLAKGVGGITIGASRASIFGYTPQYAHLSRFKAQALILHVICIAWLQRSFSCSVGSLRQMRSAVLPHWLHADLTHCHHSIRLCRSYQLMCVLLSPVP